MNVIHNPVIPGTYPDPSICRVGDDYYLICSSFELYPGIPIFHSRNLADWTQIGNVMTAANGFHVKANSLIGGVMAPTIRYSNGTFYIVNANFSDKGNFVVTATDPAGPWSEPRWMTDVPGIDASVFFDDDGSAYVLGTGDVVDENGVKTRGIWMAGYDFERMRRTTEPRPIWTCALRGAEAPESPHLYRKDGWYYLVIAEGGTEHYHAVTVARSRELFGWYEGNPANPVMTHRHLGMDAQFVNIGHADLVDTPEGDWYAAMLGSRTIEGCHKNLGRETFVCPVEWQNDWPVFSPGTGKVEEEYPLPRGAEPGEGDAWADLDCDFADDGLPARMVLWGTPYGDVYTVGNGKLELSCLARAIDQPVRCALDECENARRDDCVAFAGFRQFTADFVAECEMAFVPEGAETAGFLIMEACNHQYRLERSVGADGGQILSLVLTTTDMHGMLPHMPMFKGETVKEIVASVPYGRETVVLRIEGRGQRLTFSYGPDSSHMQVLAADQDAVRINPDILAGTSGNLVGDFVGMYASGNGVDTGRKAVFTRFAYRAA